jgi:UDP-glucose 4-epimerase
MYMNILITGASGFIGKHLTEYLSEKYHLLTPTHQQLDLLNENAVLRYFRNHTIDIVIHCAVIGGHRKEQHEIGMFYNDLRIFFNIVRCNHLFKRMINIGSGAEYDKRFPIVHVKEEDISRHVPNDEYGLYKYICANYINQMANVIDLRPFGLFGPGEDYQYRFISNAICRHIFNLPITIKQNVIFDYLYIQDFLRIIEYFVTHKPRFSAYNIGSGKRYSLISLANIINKVGDRKEKILVGRKGYANEYSCNVKRLYLEVNNISLTPIEESISRLYFWYQANKSDIDPKVL